MPHKSLPAGDCLWSGLRPQVSRVSPQSIVYYNVLCDIQQSVFCMLCPNRIHTQVPVFCSVNYILFKMLYPVLLVLSVLHFAITKLGKWRKSIDVNIMKRNI